MDDENTESLTMENVEGKCCSLQEDLEIDCWRRVAVDKDEWLRKLKEARNIIEE